MLPTVLEGLAISEFPDFVATQCFPENHLEPILTDWAADHTISTVAGTSTIATAARMPRGV